MLENKISSILLVDNNKQDLKGIITKSDLVLPGFASIDTVLILLDGLPGFASIDTVFVIL
jgi:hypothetical protein